MPRPLRGLRGRGVGGPGKWGKIGFYRHSQIGLFLTTIKEVAEIEIWCNPTGNSPYNNICLFWLCWIFKDFITWKFVSKKCKMILSWCRKKLCWMEELSNLYIKWCVQAIWKIFSWRVEKYVTKWETEYLEYKEKLKRKN